MHAEVGVDWVPRRNRADVVWNGVAIPAGTPLIFGIGAANRDPEVFPDGDRFDIDRRPQVTLTFGFGVHYCLGANLARVELQEAIEFFARRVRGLQLEGEPVFEGVGGIYGLAELPLTLTLQ